MPCFKGGDPYELKTKEGALIMKDIHAGVTTKQLAEKTAQVMNIRKSRSEDLLKQYLYPLLNIDKVPSVIDKRTNIFFPVEEMEHQFFIRK